MIKLLLKILHCWRHGFKTKTGGEGWLKRQGMAENLTYPKHSQRNP